MSKKQKLTPFFTHYTQWEDWKNGMWKAESKEDMNKYLNQAIKFTGNTELYGEWMLKVIIEWPNSVRENLSNTSQNRKAWIGHAAVCLATGIPEYITRAAWWKLTEEQRINANLKAQEAIILWEKDYSAQMC